MVSLKKIKLEHRVSIVAAIGAMLLSSLLGFVSGNDVGVIFLRALIFALVFAGIFQAGFFVLRRFVPEMFEVLAQDTGSDDVAVGAEEVDPGTVGMTDEGEPQALAGDDDSFTPMDTGTLPRFESVNLDAPAAGGTKLGKHTIEEKTLKFEPKLMAEAIRTMMSKDSE